MRARLRSWWFDIMQSLWFLPAILTATAILLALLTLRLDQTLLLERHPRIGWLFSGGVDGARGVLQAIAGSMITVSGLVFSITVVALQLASSQLSPRVLRTFMADRGNQVVLGFFIGTFTYALLVLRAVRSPLEDARSFVPSLSITVAIVLALASVALLIYFIHHAADGMRATVVIDRAATATRGLIDTLYPEDVGEPARAAPPEWLTRIPAGTVRAAKSGYLQTINADALFALAKHHALTIRPEPIVGDFVMPGAMLATVWPKDALDDEVTGTIYAALALGAERTLQTDVAFGFQQLTDIAVKALSPGINDPTTAMICIDRIGELLALLAQRRPPDEVRRGEDGSVRVVLRGPSFARLLDQTFVPIRHYGAADPIVAEHLLVRLGDIDAVAPGELREPIQRQGRLVRAASQSQLTLAEDRERVARAGTWIDSCGCDDANPAPTAAPRRDESPGGHRDS